MTHSQICKQLQIDWTAQKKGRLFLNPTGFAELEKVHYGLAKGSCDLIGFEYIDNMPCFCGIEVKTKAYPKISEDQRKFLDALVRCGCSAYVAREKEDTYLLTSWQNECKSKIQT